MIIRIKTKRGFVITTVLLAMAAWALVLLNYNATHSNGLHKRLELYDKENQRYLLEKHADQVAEIN